jgi:hypothetical protein
MYSRLIWEAETEEEIKVEELERARKVIDEQTKKVSRDLKLVAVSLATAVTSGLLGAFLIHSQEKKQGMKVNTTAELKLLLQKVNKFIALTIPTSGVVTLAAAVAFVVFSIKYLIDRSELKTFEAAKLTESYIHESWLLTETEATDDKKIFEKIKEFFANKRGAASDLGKKAKTFFNSKTGKILGGATILTLAVFALLIVKKNVAPDKSIGEFVIDLIKKIKSHPWSLGVALAVISIAGIVYLIYRKKKPEESERLKGYSKSDLSDTLTDSINY